MPKRLIIALLLVLFAFPIGLQVTRVEANHTKPITSPITNPVTFFSLSGKVTYKKLGGFFRNINRILPADDAVVTIQGFFDRSKKYTVKTDANGMYQVNVPVGMYRVEVDNDENAFFTPPLKVLNIKANTNKKANFQGLLWP